MVSSCSWGPGHLSFLGSPQSGLPLVMFQILILSQPMPPCFLQTNSDIVSVTNNQKSPSALSLSHTHSPSITDDSKVGVTHQEPRFQVFELSMGPSSPWLDLRWGSCHPLTLPLEVTAGVPGWSSVRKPAQRTTLPSPLAFPYQSLLSDFRVI